MKARRFGLLYVAPTLLVLLGITWPLISGSRTLYLRDVLTSHYPLKAAQASSLGDGELPAIDVYRAGGQPLLGNPNALPLYPDNLLYLAAHPLWALNAHFWLHLLLAPFAFFWLGRAWGLSRPAAWAAGVCYAFSGFMLSLMNLYNLVAGAALAPAFIAACLEAWSGRRRIWIAAALLWALLATAGDPFFALLALAAAVAAGTIRGRSLPPDKGRFAAALACGSALAAPMIFEFLAILPLSLRGYRSYSAESALLQSWDPRTVAEWVLPLFFGFPDFSFWGQRFYDGLPPLFYSAYPGVLCLLLIPLAGPRRSPAALWGWCLAGAGLFLALGKWNPLVRLAYEVPGASALRYPVKTWLLVAVGAALLCGAGFERLMDGGGRRRMGRLLAALVLFYAALWTALAATSLGEGLAGDPQRLRWAGLCLLNLGFLALAGMALYLMRRHAALGGALLLGVHLASQVFFLRPLVDSDVAEPYLARPELLELIPAEARLVHGGFRDLFGPQRLSRGALPFPDSRTHWLTRGHFEQLYPFSGIPWGRRYELNPSPEGLDSFFTFSVTQLLPRMSDAERLRILAASGVGVLLLDRALEAGPAPPVRLLARRPIPTGELHVYELEETAAPVQLVHRVHRVPHMNAAASVLASPAFDPRAEVVLPGEGPPALDRPAEESAGRAAVARETADELAIEVDARVDAVLVVQRTFHGIYRATVDGEAAAIQPANLHRLGVEVAAGEHAVRIRVDRRPIRIGWAVAVAGLAGLVGLGRGRRGR